MPNVGGKDVDLFLLYWKVTALGGWEKVRACVLFTRHFRLYCALNLPPLESTLIRGQFSVSGQDNEFRFAAYFRAFRCARVCFMSTSVAWI